MKKTLILILATVCAVTVLASCSAVHSVALADTWGAEIDNVYGEITFKPDNTYEVNYEVNDADNFTVYGRWTTDGQQLFLMDTDGNVLEILEYEVDANYLTFSEDIVFERK